MIFIFNKDGFFFNEVRLLREASELTGATTGQITQILTGVNGNMTSKGFYFVTYEREESEFEKQNYIDKVEKALQIIIIAGAKDRLGEKIDKITYLL